MLKYSILINLIKSEPNKLINNNINIMLYIKKNYNTLIGINYINWNCIEEIVMPILKKVISQFYVFCAYSSIKVLFQLVHC